ncbi:MAG: tRNA (guanosine(37)-N1)-methyltransferase TrmD [Lachnospiraceae bacterium]|nr:tRNA (guanosine(37)-N1)-methyltransferase TrmD [Lachnospiraceae bacterium]
MKISILTIFPEMFRDFVKEPVIARALGRKIAELEIVDIRSFAGGSFRHIDDDSYGGGAGMVMRCGPVLDALDAVRKPGSYTAVMTPAGRRYTQKTAHEFAALGHLILICGHYEGLDERILNHADGVYTIGDYVLTGGELPAKVVCDSVIRLLPGVLRSEATAEESFEQGMLEYPQYTKPAVFRGESVPEVLLTGNHERIREWRQKEALRITMERRPDLLNK